jgi:uncharacterized membrane protein
MTDPNPSPTTRIPTPGSGAEPDAPTDDATPPAPVEPPPAASQEGATTPHEPPQAPEPAAPEPDVRPAETPPPPGPAPTGSWAQPPQPRRDPGRWVSVVVGLVVLAVGLWLFAEVTLGIDLPTIRWSQLLPIILIVIGGWIVLGTMRRGQP